MLIIVILHISKVQVHEVVILMIPELHQSHSIQKYLFEKLNSYFSGEFPLSCQVHKFSFNLGVSLCHNIRGSDITACLETFTIKMEQAQAMG